VTRARDLTAAGQLASALVEAQTAVAIDPDELQAQMVLATHSPRSVGRWPRSPRTSGTRNREDDGAQRRSDLGEDNSKEVDRPVVMIPTSRPSQ